MLPQALCVCPARGGGGARWAEGGGDGDSWADLGPWGEEATDPGEAGEEQWSWRGKEIVLGVGEILGWQLDLGLGGSGCSEQ